MISNSHQCFATSRFRVGRLARVFLVPKLQLGNQGNQVKKRVLANAILEAGNTSVLKEMSTEDRELLLS